MKKLHLLTLWAINGKLDSFRLQEQLDEMKECGFDGTIFHPRYYPGEPAFMSPEYLDILSEAILHAKRIGMEFWIYDENGWPSGSGNGKVYEHFPERTCDWLVYRNGKVIRECRKNFNTFDREEMEYFIQTVYDGYRTGLSREAFEYVTGFFSDEVGFLDGHGATLDKGGVPWCPEASERLEKEFGDVEDKLELLFVEKAGYQQFRYRYWETITDILAESFYGAINCWCEKYGKRYTAHLKGEETIYFQIPCSGSCYTNLVRVNCPAVDALERYPGNHYYPRIASSLSRQFGDGQCLAEALGGSGWGLKPEDLENYVNWLAESGINYFAFHLWQYERNSASVRDWPPNIPWGMTWKQVMPSLLHRLKEQWNVQFQNQQNHCLLVAPVRGCMAEFIPEHARVINEHNGSGTPGDKSGRISCQFSILAEALYVSGMAYDVAEERLLEQNAVWENGKLRLGNILYDCVVAGDGCLWETNLPKELQEKGLWHEAKEFSWHFSGITSGMNQFPVEWTDGTAEIHYSCQDNSFLKDCHLRILDPVSCVKANGILLHGQRKEDGIIYPFDEEVVQSGKAGRLLISFEPEEGGEQMPFAFLEGNFLVKNSEAYEEMDHRQLRSTGSFYLEAMENRNAIDCNDLITSGFPFCRSGAILSARRYISPQGKLQIPEVEADCAFVNIQGNAAGAVWGPEWVLDTGLPEGIYDVEIELIPSTFNTYGPHHYWEGDRHLISPDQYRGKKNFADRPDAPVHTLIPEWHLIKWGLKNKVTV